ncbi:MAG: hypothetical protein AMJ79_09180 [Phycisphaerae bacterium SM23_30]|nr:MAG: hypothetical protein AMJ79_09180 [Phycisphaerae bacterium SM23_30]
MTEKPIIHISPKKDTEHGSERTTYGLLHDVNGDEYADNKLETLLRAMANDLYNAINEQGEV